MFVAKIIYMTYLWLQGKIRILSHINRAKENSLFMLLEYYPNTYALS